MRNGANRFSVLAPVVYGGLMLLYLLACLEIVDPSIGEALFIPATLAKLATVVAVPLALFRLGRAVEDTPALARVWWQLGLLWALLGVAIVLAIVPVGEEIARASAKPTASRIWPGTDMAAERDLFVASNPAYNLFHVVAFELGAVLVLAFVSALCVQAANRVGAAMIALLPLGVVCTLTLYAVAAPGAWIWDYDPFVGDVVLGGLLSEVVFVVAPSDPVGALALVVGASTVTVAAWRIERRGSAVVVDSLKPGSAKTDSIKSET